MRCDGSIVAEASKGGVADHSWGCAIGRDKAVSVPVTSMEREETRRNKAHKGDIGSCN
jgi:hypothetical protein